MNNKYVSDVTSENFQGFLQQSSEKVIILDFWAPWCGPCRQLSPALERITQDYAGRVLLGKINVDEQQELAAMFRIQSIPMVVIFKDGKPADHFVGALPEAEIRQRLEKILPPQVDDELNDAESLLESCDWTEAEVAFSVAHQKDSSDAETLSGLVRSMVGLGKHVEAKELWEKSGTESATIDRLFGANSFWENAVGVKPEEILEPTEEYEREQLPSLLKSSAVYARRGDCRKALEAAFQAVRLDKNYNEQLPRLAMLALFALFGEHKEIVREYRGRLATLLY